MMSVMSSPFEYKKCTEQGLPLDAWGYVRKHK